MSSPVPQATGPAPDIRPLLQRLLRREDLTRAEAANLLDALLAAETSEAQIAAALVALAAKGETAEELAGIAGAMRARAAAIHPQAKVFVDTAGTGGSAAKTFNVSTAAAFVIAGAGLPVAKHGNRAVTSNSGSADLLEALGVRVDCALAVSQRALDELGICFMFAPLYHRATARVAGVRRQLGIRTVFNLIGPLTNPAAVRRQVVGVGDSAWLERMAQALAALGAEHAWVVHGREGLDEISASGPTQVVEVIAGTVRRFEVAPEQFGLERAGCSGLRGDARGNARLVREVLSGQRRDAARSLVVATSAAGLWVGGMAADVKTAAQMAGESIDSGAALRKLQQLAAFTHQEAQE